MHEGEVLGSTGAWEMRNGSPSSYTDVPATGAFTTLSTTGTATLPTVDIAGGEIDGTNIGASTPGAGTFNALSTTGDSITIQTTQTPASAGASGTTGEIAWDTNYLYVCVATNTWKRVLLSTWS